MENVLRLLIAEASVNDAEMLISVLRNAGTAVRATHAEDEEDVQQALDEKPFDLFLCSTALESLPLPTASQLIQQSGKDIPIVAIGESDTPEHRRESLHQGAVDMVSKGDLEHLQLVIGREVNNLNDRRRLRRLESALREAEKRCNALLDSSRDAIAYVHEGMHIYANPAYLEKFGFENFEEIEGTPILDMVAGDSQSAFKDLLRTYDRGDHSNDEIEVNMQILGSPKPVQLTLAPASIEGESCTQILIRDRSSDEELQAQLDTLAKQDLLTGLYNRSHFMERLEDALSATGNSQATEQRALIYVKLDNLDGIRQNLGIAATDLVIGDTANLIRKEAGDEEVAARFGDDAFAILSHGKNIHETISLAEAIRQAVEEHVAEAGEKTITTSCSIGIAMIGDRIGTGGEAVSAAHQACDTARSEGGNRVHLYSASAGGEDGENQEEDWASRLEEALANDLLILMYQPIVSLSGDSQERYEVRLRMHGENGLVSPNKFMPHADRLQLMPTVDRWVVRQVLAVASARARDGHNTQFFVKLSAATVSDENFLKFIAAELQSAPDVAATQLVLEVNEPVAVTQLNQTKSLFRALKEAGCEFCLDHFGSGLNPFQLVKHIPADFLKLDRTLVENLPESQENADSIHQIVENAHAMQKKVIAGHIEEAGHLASLWQSKTDFAQGTFLQEPQRDMSYDFSGLVL